MHQTRLSSFRFRMCDKPLSPCLSTVSIPSAFYASLPPYHRNQLPLHPLHHSRTTVQQLSQLVRAAAHYAPFWPGSLTQSCACFSRIINRLPGKPPTGPLWHTYRNKRRHSGVSLCPLLLAFRTPFWPHLPKTLITTTSQNRPLPLLAMLLFIYKSDVTLLIRYHLRSWWGAL